MFRNVDFRDILGSILLQAAYAGHNADGTWRIGPPPPDASGKRVFEIPGSAASDIDNFTRLQPFFAGYNDAFHSFEDEASGKILAMIIARRILGPERTMLNITPTEYSNWMTRLDPLLVTPQVYSIDCVNMVLDLYDLNQAGMPIRVHTSRSSLLAHYFLKQYEFKRDDALVTVEPGDTVIEGGMCFGDTALLFAHMAGETGRVIGYEFETNNLKILRENFNLNPELAGRIEVVEKALSDASGKEMIFAMAGPGTFPYTPGLDVGYGTVTVETLTVDDLVDRRGLEKVDFIKLDVEGAEVDTMLGAKETLRKFRPKLALSAYHKHNDVQELIRILKSLNLGYRFWLDHFRPYDQETVLFAKAF